jgi:hypothetical protein
MKKHLLAFCLLFMALRVPAQEIISCPTGTTYWYIDESPSAYALSFTCNVQKNAMEGFVDADGIIMEYYHVSPEGFDTGGSNPIDILTQHARYEADFFDGFFGENSTTLHTETVALPNGGGTALYWTYKLPDTAEGETALVHFMEIIAPDGFIFCLVAPQSKLAPDSLQIKPFLAKTLATFKTADNKDTLCK